MQKYCFFNVPQIKDIWAKEAQLCLPMRNDMTGQLIGSHTLLVGPRVKFSKNYFFGNLF